MALPNLGAHPDAVDMAAIGATGALQREIRSNARDHLIERAKNTSTDLDVTAGGTFVLTVDQALATGLLRFTGTPAGAFTIQMPVGDRRIVIENATAQTALITTTEVEVLNLETGSPDRLTLEDGSGFLLLEDGSVSIAAGAIRWVHKSAGVVLATITGAVLMRAGTISPSGNFDWADFELARPKFKNTAQVVSSPSSSSGVLNIDLELGNAFNVTLTEDITTLNFLNIPVSGRIGTVTIIFSQDATGSWNITWPSSVVWEANAKLLLESGIDDLLTLEDGLGSLLLEGNAPPPEVTDVGSVTIYNLVTSGNGIIWYGFVLGRDMK